MRIPERNQREDPMKLIDKYLTTPNGIRSVVPAVTRHLISRGRGYIVNVDGEWYEIDVIACEPPDSEDPVQDVLE